MFDCNASLNGVAPLSPMLFSVDLVRMKRVDCCWMLFVCCSFCLHGPDQAE